LGQEKLRIAETRVINNDNLLFGAKGGNDTTDKIFLLSIEEADKYFGNSGDLNKVRKRCDGDMNKYIPANGGLCFSNNYDANRIAYDESGEPCLWWLRLPGDKAKDFDYPPYVMDDGAILNHGLPDDEDIGIRPALWLKL
jgi:hypothetical protein